MRFFVSSPRYTTLVLLVGLRFTAASTPSGFEPAVANDLPMAYADDTYVHAAATLPENGPLSDGGCTTLYLPPGESADAEYAAVMVGYDVNVYGTEMTMLQWYQPGLAAVSRSGGALSVVNASGPSASPRTSRSRNACGPVPETGRAGFNLDEFVRVAGLGDPVAANWFKMQNPSSATTTYAIAQMSTASYACTSSSA
ncbi:hypothetical protein BDW71DRAFT_209399 [Aspergillus fruticulosus]